MASRYFSEMPWPSLMRASGWYSPWGAAASSTITRSAYRPLLDTTIFFASFGLSFALLCHTLRGFGKPFSQISY